MAEILVDWPSTAPLSEVQWRARMEDLAERAERLIGRSDITLQARARLACEWLGLAWSGFSPATIAASARGSLLLGENVVLAAAPCDQIAEMLDLIWQEARAQDDPVDGVVEAPALLLELPHRPADRPNTRQRKPRPEPDDLLDGADPLEPADLPAPVADPDPDPPPIAMGADLLEPAAAATVAPAPVADPDPPPIAMGADPLAPVAAAVEPEPAAPEAPPAPDAPPAPAEPEPLPPTPPAPAPDTAGWLSVPEVAELLEISAVTIWRWRIDGRMGQEDIDWMPHGRSFVFSTAVVEAALKRLEARRQARSNRTPRPGRLRG